MIKIKKHENEKKDPFGDSESVYTVYEVGEITSIEVVREPYGSSHTRNYFDSKGRMFAAHCKSIMGRVVGYVPIEHLQERLDIVPQKCQEVFLVETNGRVDVEFRCIDPRVIWGDVVYTWLRMNITSDLDEISKILTENLPSYQDAIKWLKKNKLRVFAPEPDHGIDPVSDELRLYYGQYNKLYYPPEIDWERYNVSVPEGRGIMGKD